MGECITCREELPRVYELIDMIEDRSAPSAYFQDFENSISGDPQKKQVWLAREAELDILGEDAWCSLKNKAHPYLTARNPKRGWEQLISVLNEPRAYGYLQRIGCSSLRFIPEGPGKTPDIEGKLGDLKVLCEVKTIQTSEEEASARCGTKVMMTENQVVTPEFFGKLLSDLDKAKEQILAYEGGANARRVVYVIINFDDLLGEYKAEYYKQIDAFLAQEPIREIEIVFHNGRTRFHTQIDMKFATVVNE